MNTEHTAAIPPRLSQSTHMRASGDGLKEIVVSSGISLRLWRLYAQAWLVCLLFPLLTLVQLHQEPVRLALAFAGLAVFVAVYTWVMWAHPLHMVSRVPFHVQRSLLLLAGLTALTLVLTRVYGASFLWLFIGVSAIAGVTLPARAAFLTVMALTLLTLGVSLAVAGNIARADWLHMVPLVLLVRGLGLDMVGLARLSLALRELYAAREERARLAVAEERLRVARDLHDLLGHSLSLITLKSELARRLVERDPAQAAHEIGEVERVARQTLRQVREAVAGYRQPCLEGELDAARQLLEAAGITYIIECTVQPLPPLLDGVLAWAIREGVTNVIRHSRAHQCHIRVSCALERARAEITNDGDNAKPAANQSAGCGLAGLTERVRACGGYVEAGPFQEAGTNGFRLCVDLPLPGEQEQQ